ncbi:MAG: hypothetical protein HWD60_03045 [Defluviicoccus sp.]|nr:MAG: hypothetical protein HWD60_03045 [Defluviicoccus sp.]
MAKIRSVFPGLRTVADDDIGVFYGVHGRSPVAAGNPHHTPSDILAIHGHPGLPGYLEPSGGLATTAIRDAVEVAAEVARRTGLDPIAPAERLVWSMAIGASAGIRNHLGARARWQKALVA